MLEGVLLHGPKRLPPAVVATHAGAVICGSRTRVQSATEALSTKPSQSHQLVRLGIARPMSRAL